MRIAGISCAIASAAACRDDGGPTGGGNNTVALTARHGHSMIYDELRHRLLLFGGVGTEGTSSSGDRNSIWVWDGTTWTRIATTSPSARYHAELAYDATRQRVVLFGGFNASAQQELRDIWEWDGTTWQQSSVSGPANTISLGIAYDEKTAALYFFSMAAGGGTPVASRWSGTALAPALMAAPPCVPVPRQFTALGSNPGGFLIYVHSCDQAGGAVLPQSWRRDGATWTRIAGTQPPVRYNSALAYDRDRNRVVLYGGEVGAGTPDRADTWEFDGTTWTQR